MRHTPQAGLLLNEHAQADNDTRAAADRTMPSRESTWSALYAAHCPSCFRAACCRPGRLYTATASSSSAATAMATT